MPDSTDIARRVKEVIVRALNLQVEPEEISDDEIIFGQGIGADSTATLEVIFAIEEEFGIEVEDEDLRPDLLSSVDALTDYIGQRKAKDAEATERAPVRA